MPDVIYKDGTVDRLEEGQNLIRKWVKNGCWWDNMGNDSCESAADSIFSAVE